MRSPEKILGFLAHSLRLQLSTIRRGLAAESIVVSLDDRDLAELEDENDDASNEDEFVGAGTAQICSLDTQVSRGVLDIKRLVADLSSRSFFAPSTTSRARKPRSSS